jgi:hypothetical protein
MLQKVLPDKRGKGARRKAIWPHTDSRTTRPCLSDLRITNAATMPP